MNVCIERGQDASRRVGTFGKGVCCFSNETCALANCPWKTHVEVNHDGWRKPKAKSAAKEKAQPILIAVDVLVFFVFQGASCQDVTNGYTFRLIDHVF